MIIGGESMREITKLEVWIIEMFKDYLKHLNKNERETVLKEVCG